MGDSTNICLACGCCCDGTMIGFVQLDPEELPVLRDLVDVENGNGEGFLLHPCQKYCDGCTIYSRRPKQCALFKCELLKSVEQKELDFDSAVQIVDELKQRRIAIEEKLALLQIELPFQSFCFKMVGLKNLFQKSEPASFTQNHMDLKSDLERLDSLLTERFGVSIL